MSELERQKSNVPAYIQQSMQSIEGMMEYATVILKSKLAPQHFYEKGPDNKPDYTKGMPEAVLIVLQHGMEVGLSVSQSLQQVVPINGLISVKGTGAISLIFKSGVLEPGSWKETVSGTIEGGDYKVEITSQRSDNGIIKTSDFSIIKAKQAGLWITKAMVEGKDGWKYKHSPWNKYPERMIFWRCVGFHANSHYPDVLAGMYTFEEAQDMPQDTTEVVEVASGGKITINDAEFTKERSETLTSRVADKINERNDTIPEAEEIPGGHFEPVLKVWNEDELKVMGPKILDLIESDYPEILHQLNALPGKRTNKKYRLGILAHQMGRFDEFMQQSSDIEQPAENEQEQEQGTPEADPQNPTKPSEATPPEQVDQPGDKTEEAEIYAAPFEIPVLPEGGTRPFDEVKDLYHHLEDLGVTEDVYAKLMENMADEAGEVLISLYPDKQAMCRNAGGEVIVNLYNAFLSVN